MLSILFTKTISNSSILYLEIRYYILIKDHYQTYCKLFEDTLKLKFHLLLHYPRMNIFEVNTVIVFYGQKNCAMWC